MIDLTLGALFRPKGAFILPRLAQYSRSLLGRFRGESFKGLLLLILTISGLANQACAQSKSESKPLNPIAKVALAVGETMRISGGQFEPLRVGAHLVAGDRIRTGPDAVAILVFADEGRLSIRPDSELWIKQYDIDPKGINTRIELELVKGIVRQISGTASRLQPDRYRLNTPVAAIGVRGTDFLAKSSRDGVETLVQEGKIFVQANNLQNCAQIDCGALLGPAQAAGSYMKLSASGEIEQRAYRATDVEQSFALNLVMQPNARRQTFIQAAELQRLKLSDAELPSGAQFISDTIFTVSQNKELNYDVAQGGGSSNSNPTAPPSTGGGTTVSGGNSTGGASGLPEDLATSASALLERQLVWGRFSQAASLPSSWTVSYAEAKEGRHVTVGELGQYALWRSGETGRLDSSLAGYASFNLLGAQAVLEQSGAVTAAVVNSAVLEIDFDRSTFLAGVDMRHQATGLQHLKVTGIVNNEGIFVGTNDTERVAGALSRDGSEAGYLFSKDTSAGRLRGITLWARKK
jgi:hypothetical protein